MYRVVRLLTLQLLLLGILILSTPEVDQVELIWSLHVMRGQLLFPFLSMNLVQYLFRSSGVFPTSHMT